MQRLSGQLNAGERVVFRSTDAVFEEPIPGRPRTGHFEVLEGSVPFLSIVRTYRIALEDGHSEEIHVTGIWAGAEASLAAFAFRAGGEGVVSGPRDARPDDTRRCDDRDRPGGR